MEAMIVTWSQVDDHVHHLVASLSCSLQEPFSRGLLVGARGLALVAKQEFINSVGVTLDAVHSGGKGVDLAIAQNTPIAR